MPIFRYVAVSADGREDRGMVEAESPRLARSELRNRKLTALSVEPTGATADTDAGSGQRLKSGDLALITRQCAALLSAGLTAENALNALIEQSPSAAIQGILARLRAEVRAGSALADAMSRQPRAFPDLYRALIRGGEEAGALTRVMAELADHLEAREQIRQKLALALLYPATISIVAALVVIGLMIYVVPQIASVFTHTRQTLPWLTTALLGVTGFLRQTGVWLILAAAAGVFLFQHLYKTAAFRRRVQHALLALPVAGRLFRLEAGARFASTLAILLSGGVPMLRALDAAAEGASLDVFKDAARRAADRVREGAPLSRALKIENLFPPLLLHFIASGEAGGELPAMLQHAAQQLQGELENRLRWLGGLLEPALIVVMGTVVLAIVLAVLMPIIEMNHLLR